jgi:hypothetical protein
MAVPGLDAGIDPAIQTPETRVWMPGSRPGMTAAYALSKGFAGEIWRAGDKALAQIRLAFLGLPKIDEADAYRLFLAGTALEKGLDPSDLMKALGFPRAARDIEKYSVALEILARTRQATHHCRRARNRQDDNLSRLRGDHFVRRNVAGRNAS